MTLAQRLSEYVAAAFTGLWIQSFEHDDALSEIAKLCHDRGWSLATWDIDRGLQSGGQSSGGGAASDPRGGGQVHQRPGH
jgi:hypothetical protein